MVLDVDPQKRRISLGLKQTLANPWDAFIDEHPIGSELEGEVRNITEFGLFVGLPGDIDGMVHLSDIDWNRTGEDAIANYRKGEAVRVKVLDVDAEKERISLGIKQLEADPFEAGMSKLRKGEVVTGTIAGITEGGIEVSVGDGLLGFIRKSELSRDRSEQRPDRFAVGEKIDAKVTAIDRATRKVGLSIKAREVDEEKRAMAEFGSSDFGRQPRRHSRRCDQPRAPAGRRSAGRHRREELNALQHSSGSRAVFGERAASMPKMKRRRSLDGRPAVWHLCQCHARVERRSQ